MREIKENGRDIGWWHSRFLRHIVGRYYERFSPSGVPVVEHDWDNLILLDGCRYDLFRDVYEEYDLSGDLDKRRSSNSATRGFLNDNFSNETFHDTVYVTANAWVDVELDSDSFYEVIHVWKDGWDNNLGTVPPETMAQVTLDAADAYPNKRIISHLLQPHTPFIGNIRVNDPSDRVSHLRESVLGNELQDGTKGAFKQLKDGDISRDEAWQAYRSNLERAVPSVVELLDGLSGRTLVTADHGEAFGEWAKPFPVKLYGHPAQNLYVPALTDVPALVVDNGSRREIIIESRNAEPKEPEGTEEVAMDRLQQLGYIE